MIDPSPDGSLHPNKTLNLIIDGLHAASFIVGIIGLVLMIVLVGWIGKA